jgi:serine/threonine protein phosphatase PrpC
MSIKTKENEKKLISEYVQLSNKAKILYKSKNYEEALDIFKQCEKKCIDITSYDKKCECFYYYGLCHFKLYNCELCYKYLKKSRDCLNFIDKNTFPYLKFHGRLDALILLMLIGMDKIEESINFINNEIINDLINKFNLEEKVVVFHRLIKDLLEPIKTSKMMAFFLGEYISEQNNILFNGDKNINIGLKNLLNKCLNINTKNTLFSKNNIYYYKYKYQLSNANLNPIIIFLENNLIISEENNINNNIYPLKMSLENHIKNNKIKIGDDFKGVKPLYLIKEYIQRIENFNEFWKNMNNIFNESFKNYFSNNKKIMKFSSTNDIFSIKKEVTQKPVDQFSQSMKNNDNIKLKKKLSVGNNIGNNIVNNNNIPNNNPKHNRRQSSNIIGRITLKEDTKNKIFNTVKDNSVKNKKMNRHSLFLENNNIKKNLLLNENNNYDENRIKNKNTNIENTTFYRNYNPFLFSTISKKYYQDQQIRPCDLINLKSNNCVKNYSTLSQKGKHKVIGIETEDVNQDIVFLNPNFLLIKNLYLFGICDGHGVHGHYVSSYIKQILPAYLNYIEIDNYISKKNKSLDSMLSSLYNKSENSSVKDIHIIKYFYDKFQINISEFSYMKNRFSEISKNLKEAFSKIDNELIKSKQNFDTKKSGSTVCMGIINYKNLFMANIGDSRAILCSCNNNNWKSSQLTKDHKPKDKSEYKRILAAGGTVSRMINTEKNDEEIGPYRVWDKIQDKGPGLAMSRSIGDGQAKNLGVLNEPDIFEYVLNEGDKFIVCASDGVWEYLSNDDVMNIVKDVYVKEGKADEACEILVKKASDEWRKENNNTMDDISCAILFLNVK